MPVVARLVGDGCKTKMAVTRARAAGPCCHAAWLPTVHRSDPRHAARTAGKRGPPQSKGEKQAVQHDAGEATRTAIARFAI